MTDLTIHGHTITIGDLDDGEIATDVIVLTRVCAPHEDGITDYVQHATTTNTTGIIKTGILNAARQADAAKWVSSFGGEEDDQ